MLVLRKRGHYFIARKERAFLDILYLNKGYHFDNLAPLILIRYLALLPIYNNKRMVKKVHTYLKNFQAE